MLPKHRDTAAARRFFKRVVIDKSGANLAGLQAVKVILKFTGTGTLIKILNAKYLNNILEQDHRFIKRITAPMLGFKALHSTAATVAGIEAANMIRKGQLDNNDLSAFQEFAALAA
jgi:putative transposase